jgi:hypothetical protein
VSPDKGLTLFQQEIVRLLARFRPAPSLTGGGALVGFFTRHRRTDDLDYFWHGMRALGDLAVGVEALLAEGSLSVDRIESSPAFRRLRVSRGTDVCIVDLVADPSTVVESPIVRDVDGVEVLVDAPHEILVNKLTALLSRSEVRDLDDVRALLAAGGDLPRALGDAPRKDGGFSPLTLAWVLESFAAAELAESLGWDRRRAADLDEFRRSLIDRLLRESPPPAP